MKFEYLPVYHKMALENHISDLKAKFGNEIKFSIGRLRSCAVSFYTIYIDDLIFHHNTDEIDFILDSLNSFLNDIESDDYCAVLISPFEYKVSDAVEDVKRVY